MFRIFGTDWQKQPKSALAGLFCSRLLKPPQNKLLKPFVVLKDNFTKSRKKQQGSKTHDPRAQVCVLGFRVCIVALQGDSEN